MTDNEIKREQPSFEVRAESLKKRTKEFFSTYENPNGSEDRLEICLIREGYRAVLMAEEEINRQKAEIERLEDLNKCYYTSCQQIAKSNHEIKAEAVKEFAERLKEKATPHYFDNTHFAVKVEEIDNLLKERVGES